MPCPVHCLLRQTRPSLHQTLVHAPVPATRCPSALLLSILQCPVRIACHTAPASHSMSRRRHWLTIASHFLSRQGLPAPMISPTWSPSCRPPVQAARKRSPLSRPTGLAPGRLASPPHFKVQLLFEEFPLLVSTAVSNLGRVVRI